MKSSIQRSLKVIVASIILATSTNAQAQEALELDAKMKLSCADKDEGDICDFTNDKGESINGQCKRSGSSSDSGLRCIATN